MICHEKTVEEEKVLRTYKLFKDKFEPEPYLSMVQHRVALRVTSHRLAIEVGRYNKPTPIATTSPLALHYM